MIRTGVGVLAATALALAAVPAGIVQPASAEQKTIKIGFISTFSGPTAAIGNDMRNAFELGLDHLGRKLGGLPVEVIYEDDTQKPDVGVQKTQKLIESDKVDFIVGYIWSNVLLASLKPLVDSKTVTVVTNAGASAFAGELCSPYVFSTSWQNDQTPEAMGMYMNQKGVKSVFLIGPNYAAGKDMLAGVKITYKGKVLGEELTRWPDQLDFSAELSKAREAKPDAIFVFYPGGAGVQFITQYVQAGLKGKIPLYQAFTIDELSIPRLKDLAVGIPGAQEWVNDLPNDDQQEIRRRLHRQVQITAFLLRRSDLRCGVAAQQRGDGGQRRPLQERGNAQGNAKGGLQIRARQFQVRQQSHPDPEFLSAGRGERRRRLCTQDRRHDRRERSGSLPRPLPDEIGPVVLAVVPSHADRHPQGPAAPGG